MAEQPEKVWLNSREAAAYAGVSWVTLRRMVEDHDIPHIKRGRRWMFKPDHLDDALSRLAMEQVGRPA